MSDDGWSETVTCPRCGFGGAWRYQGDQLWRCEDCGATDVLPSLLKGPTRVEPAPGDPERSRETA
jgi:ribosomal protein L37AE/L43A